MGMSFVVFIVGPATFDEIKILKSLEQSKGVASADKNCLRFFGSYVWILCFVRGFEGVAHGTKPHLGCGRIRATIIQCEWKK